MKIFLYPNPANTELKLNANQKNNYSLEIFDAIGNLVLNTENNNNSINLNIKINPLSSGIYFIKITSEGKSTTKKFIKQ